MPDPGLEAETPVPAVHLTATTQGRRLAQILGVVTLALCANLAMRAASGTSHQTPWPQWATLVMLAAAFVCLRKGAQAIASTLTLASLTTLLLSLVLMNEGLRDEAMVALPGVLVVAVLLGQPRQMLILLVIMLTAIVALGVANLNGAHLNRVAPVTPSTILDLCVVLAVTAFSVALLAGDLARAAERLREENERVRRSHEQIEYLATHDALTGLPNRLMARDRFDRASAAARRNGSKVALLYIDIDQFKTVNDAMGHRVGDDLLCRMGERLSRSIRASDTVSRQGGDEFLVVLDGLPHGDAVAEAATKVLKLMAESQRIDGVDLRLGASMGVALFPDDGDDFDTLLKNADIAMYRAKDGGRGTMCFYDRGMNESVGEYLTLVDGMRLALQRGEFVLHYQPQFSLASGRLVGAEALLRWNRPGFGPISPARFIPVAEQSGQIVEIGAWVLREACRQASAWHRRGLDGLVISVNLSPVQVRRGVIERDVQAALQASGLDPSLLELEVTESLLIDDCDALRDTLARLRRQGIRFSIDDFGTGYSNLAYLKRFQFERLKIDQSFIRRLVGNPDDEAIVRAIVQMAHALRLDVVAEGIEDTVTLARVRELGCDDGQGFLWSPAVPAAEFVTFARRHLAEAVHA